MLYDYWMYVGELEWIVSMLFVVVDILQWYEDRMGENGLLGLMEWWNFVDWVGGWLDGVFLGVELGGFVFIGLQWVYNL